MRSLRWLVFASALTCTGCFQSTTVVTVKGDGSGTIEQKVLITGAALAQIRQLGAFANGSGKPFEPFSEEQARSMAASLGTNVTYVSSMPISGPDAEGRNIIYAFTDITQLRVSQQPPAPGGVTVRSPELDTTNATGVQFALDRQPDGNVRLRITMPETRLPAIGEPAGQATNRGLSADQLAMIKPMLAGAHLAVAVEVVGRLVKTTSQWADGSRVTLMDVDFDQLLKDDTALERLQTAGTSEKARAMMKDMPGVKINTDREITIEFTPKP